MFEIKLKPEVKKASEAGTGSSSTSTGTPRKETVYAKMVSLRRRTTSGDLKKIFVKPLSIGKSSAASERPRVQSESGIGKKNALKKYDYFTLKTSSFLEKSLLGYFYRKIQYKYYREL